MGPSTRWPRLVTLGAGVVLALLGLVIIAGWHFHVLTILQPRPDLIAPVYNTALSFLLCGVGLLAIALGWPTLALPCGGIAALLGVLNLIQLVHGVDLGIDQLLMAHYITTKTTHPGRMAPNTSVCFVLAGVALLLQGTPASAGRRPPIVGLLGSVVMALGIVALSGYLVGFKTYGWGRLLPMAPQTAGGFTVLGVGVLAAAWREGRSEALAAPRWLPIPVGVGGLTITLCLWQPLVAQGHDQIGRTVEAELAGVTHVIGAEMEARGLPLVLLARRWEQREQPPREAWELDAGLIVGHFADFQAIVRVDPALRARWVVPVEGDEADPDRDRRWRPVLSAARDRRDTRLGRAARGAGGAPELLIAAPIVADGNWDGAMLGILRLRAFFTAILPADLATGYAITVSDGADELFARDPEDRRPAEEWGQEAVVTVHGASWRVRVWPRAGQLARSQSAVPTAVIVVGGLTALLLAWEVHLALNLRLTLAAIRAAVSQLASTSTELLAGTSQQAASLQEQAAAVMQTVATVAEVATNSEDAARRARGVGETVQHILEIGQQGRQAVNDSSHALEGVQGQVEATAEDILLLADRAQAIGAIIAAVDEIAAQTNLLALNAAIEASRAGEQGWGFAVIAREVKALAEQSRLATVQVRQILGEIQKATNTSVRSTEKVAQDVAAAIRVGSQAGEVIKTLADALAGAAHAVEQIVAASSLQTTRMFQVNQAMKNVEQVELQSTTAIRQFEQAARDLTALSTRLAALAAD